MSSWFRSVVSSSSPIFGVGKIKYCKTYQAIGLFSLFACAVNAQDAGGLTGSLSVSQRLSYGTSTGFVGGGDLQAQTNVGLSLASQTRSQSFSLDVGSGLAWSSEDTTSFEFANPNFRLSYGRESKNAGFSAGLTYRTVDLESQFVLETLDGDFTVLGSGTRTDASASVGLEFGRTDPIGGSLSASHRIIRYDGTLDPELLDSDTTNVSGQVNLRFDPRITGRVSGSWTYVDQSDGSTRTTTSVGVGAALEVNQTLTTDIGLNYSIVESSTSATREGFGLSASLSQTLQNGSLTGSISTDIGGSGRATNINIGRSMSLQNGSVSASIGGSFTDDSGFSPLYGFSYETEIVRGGNLSANLTQVFNATLDGEEAVRTNLSVNYNKALDRVSSISSGFTFRDNNVTSTTGEDSSRLDLNLNYRRELAQDWGIVGGYTHSISREDGEADRSTNTFFLGVDKTFNWRR